MSEYISAAKAGEILGLTQSYSASIARRAYKDKKEGDLWPRKIGRGYQAPLEEWTIIFSKYSRKAKRKAKQVQPKKAATTYDRERLATCSEAAQFYGISQTWASQLARRANLAGFSWPIKSGRIWFAPMEEWKVIFSSPRLKSGSRQKR
ncbi:hypothetical protein GCM10011571_32800 [Marinithermofilum abyssi]|uniref:Uncharacterized protein n=1 Tax=Marinithermofilum abyssi TaxID=1571185 RepID=A0A8J2VJ69_9BACL|nr:hypothetical protein [Marinithermofilum abyssi]GGE28145.1 hypothetical protein GCM10011571_32800 [Marinithermofilum abyssi]